MRILACFLALGLAGTTGGGWAFQRDIHGDGRGGFECSGGQPTGASGSWLHRTPPLVLRARCRLRAVAGFNTVVLIRTAGGAGEPQYPLGDRNTREEKCLIK